MSTFDSQRDPPSSLPTAGRVVIELFDDVAPVTVAAFRNRCSEGASDTFRGTQVFKLIRDLGLWGGRSAK